MGWGQGCVTRGRGQRVVKRGCKEGWNQRVVKRGRVRGL